MHFYSTLSLAGAALWIDSLILAATSFSVPTPSSNMPKPTGSNVEDQDDGKTKSAPSKWSQRTAKRRKKTQNILSSIDIPPFLFDHDSKDQQHIEDLRVPTLDSPPLDWDSIDPLLDPQQGGKLKANSPRAKRKRAAIEAFTFVAKELLSVQHGLHGKGAYTQTYLDAGSGAGNLVIPLGGILEQELLQTKQTLNMLAIDVNALALDRLYKRWQSRESNTPNKVTISTLCADLAQISNLPKDTTGLFSLHACGAATDMAIRIATSQNIPFIISPCCIGKVTTQRIRKSYVQDDLITSRDFVKGNILKSASFHRSAPPEDITYPRSDWLHEQLSRTTYALDTSHPSSTSKKPDDTILEKFSLLAKIADMGLGPQSSEEQKNHQRMAKEVVELDRLMGAAENQGYDVRLLKLKNHEGYGKKELLLGAPIGSIASKIFQQLPVVEIE